MAFQDRDYARRGGPGDDGSAPPRLSWRSVTAGLIAVNVAVYVLDQALIRMGYFYDFGGMGYLMGPLEYWGHFSAMTAVEHGQVWRLVTFQFLHANIDHILFNMIGLVMFGPLAESELGHRRFAAFYLLSGVGGAVCYLLLWAAGVVVTLSWTPLVGASAGVFGVIVAGAVIAPRAEVMLLFPPIPMTLRTLAIGLIGVAVVTIVFFGDRWDSNAGGEAGHLGGALVGWVLMRYPKLLAWLKPKRRVLPGDDPWR